MNMYRIIYTALITLYCTQAIAVTLGEDVRNACEKLSLSVLKGHQLLTGVSFLDNELCKRMQNAQPLCDNVQMRKNRDIAIGLILRQIKTELKDLYGIDCSLSDFYFPLEESDRIDLASARTRINSIITQGMRHGDPAFAVIAIERALFAKESPKTVMMNIIQSISGIPSVSEDFNAVGNLLTLALCGNTIAAQYAWQEKRIPTDWLLSFSELTQLSAQKSKQIRESTDLEESEKLKKLEITRDVQNSIQRLNDIGSLSFQYLLARSIFIDKQLDDVQKMDILASLDTGASLDYWGVLYYANMIANTKPGTETTFSNENATVGWHTYFANVMHRPLSQHIAVRKLLKKDGKPLPRGYIKALYDFAGIVLSCFARTC
jgi:hypothetical protein